MSFRGGSTLPNLLYLHRYRCNKVCRVLCTCSGCIESPRTFSNHIITKIARYVAFCHMSSGWFDCTEPSLSTSLKGKQGVQGAYGLVSNLLEPHHYSDSKVFRVLSHEFGVVRPYRTFSIYIATGETRSAGCLCSSSGWFKHIEPRRTLSNYIITEVERFVEFCTCSGLFTCIEPPRTFSNHIITEIARCLEFCHMSSGYFDRTKPSLSTSLEGKQGVQGAYALVRGDSTTSNLVEPSGTTSLQR